MQSYLEITYISTKNEELLSSGIEQRSMPNNASVMYNCPILNYDLLTSEDDRKVYNLKLSNSKILDEQYYEPGVSIGVLPSNDGQIVSSLIIRLGLENVCDQHYKLSILTNTTKKNPQIPKHIPKNGTLRNVFLHHVDIRTVPKKMFLKSLSKFTYDRSEQLELEFLSSPKGSVEYNKLISNYSERSLLGLLNKYSSCSPSVEMLLECLPPLLPRMYSISSSPLNENFISIIFNVERYQGLFEKGLCSGWLESCIEKFKESSYSEIPIYFRKSSNFKLPEDNSIPIIMIATGTGISPFRGFLEHRHIQILNENVAFGESWLIYGCRDSGQNYLCKSDIKEFLGSKALTNLSECFSREFGRKTYVQDNIEKFGEEIISWIVEKNAVIYVCGDFLRVLPAVKNAFLNILIKFHKLNRESSELFMKMLEGQNRYITESWC